MDFTFINVGGAEKSAEPHTPAKRFALLVT